MKIALPGPVGSYTEQAALRYLQNKKLDLKPAYYFSPKALVEALCDQEEIQMAVMPLSLEDGTIFKDTLNALGLYRVKVREIIQDTSIYNLACLPKVPKEEIKYVSSWTKVIMDCSDFLSKEYPEIEIIYSDHVSTAVKNLLEGLLPEETAVVCSEAAAKNSGLKVIARDIAANPMSVKYIVVTKR